MCQEEEKCLTKVLTKIKCDKKVWPKIVYFKRYANANLKKYYIYLTNVKEGIFKLCQIQIKSQFVFMSKNYMTKQFTIIKKKYQGHKTNIFILLSKIKSSK